MSSLGSKNTLTSEERKTAQNRFFQLYYGSLGAVEDDAIDAIMVMAHDILAADQSKGCTTDLTALLLAHCVKHSLECTWGVKLGEPRELPCTAEGFENLIASEGACFARRNASDLNFSCPKS